MVDDIGALLIAFRRGDKAAFETICKQYRPMLLSACSFVLHTCENADADELYQEATIALYRAALAFDAEQSEVSFGLYARTCVRRALSAWVRQNTHTEPPVPVSAESDANELLPEERILEEEAYRHMIARVRTLLSEFEYRIFAMYLHGYERQQVCRIQHITAKQYDNVMYRIRRKLRKSL